MELKNIGVFWVKPGWKPLASNVVDRKPYKTLSEAIDAIEDAWRTSAPEGHEPWLRAGTGGGSAMFDLHGIRVLQTAMGRPMLKP